MRIQFEYDILSKNIVDLSVTAFNRQDAKDSTETIDLIQKGDLVIRDLGYMHISVLNRISGNKAASYVSRLDPRTMVYEKINDKYERIDFGKLREEMMKNKITIMEKTVYLGEDHSHYCRLTINTLPPEIEEQRLRKIRQDRKRNGSGEPTKELKERSRLILIITNDIGIKKEHLYSLYMVRWQIELVFKTWKSVCGISSIKKVNRFRVECYIYGKLLLILLAWKIFQPLMNYAYNYLNKKKISYYKLMKTIVKRIKELSDILVLKTADMKAYLKSLVATMQKNRLEVKKGDKFCMDVIAASITIEKSIV